MSGKRRQVGRQIDAIAARQHGVVTRKQLVQLGLRPSAVDRRIRSGALRPLHRGVYQVGPLMPSGAREMAAVLASGPGAVLSHRSAASLWKMVPHPATGGYTGGYMGAGAGRGVTAQDGVTHQAGGTHQARSGAAGPQGRGQSYQPLPATDGGTPAEVIIPGGDRGRRPGIRVHRVMALEEAERTELSGIPLTTPARTLFDLAGVVSLRALERALARGVRLELVDRPSLLELFSRHGGRPGIAAFRSLLQAVGAPALTRSQAEERFLAMIRRARLPAPETNVMVGGHEVDFFWRTRALVVEVDGYRFHSSRRMFENDRRRDARLAALGIHVLRLTWRQVVEEDLPTAVLVGQALARARRP